MKCVERIDNEYCGGAWCVDNFHRYYKNTGEAFLEQCRSFCLLAQQFLDDQVHNIDEDVNEQELDHLLHLLASYNKYGVSLCHALDCLYEPLVADFAMLENDTNERWSLNGNEMYEPLYSFVGATKNNKLVAATLYELNIQTNVSFMMMVLNYIERQIKAGYYEDSSE